jgi:transposase
VGEITTIGLDIAKSVFQAHGADASGSVVFRKKLGRARLLAFFAAQPPCVVAMEACAGAHHWGRELIRQGHTVRLIPPAYVKPFVKRQKNDEADAEAICEAAQRPTMRFVPVKSEDQQASGVVFRARDLLVRQRTQIINALRGHMAEYGWVAAKGVAHVQRLVERIKDPAEELPQAARATLQVMVQTLRTLDDQIVVLDREIARRATEDPVAARLMTIPGVGPVTAAAIVALAPSPETFRCGRDFSAWLGLTPRQHSSGGKEKLGQITKMGERTLRRLLTIGASAVIKQASLRGAPVGSWLAQMLARKPKMLVTVALANKTARIVWALLARGGIYRAPAVAAA